MLTLARDTGHVNPDVMLNQISTRHLVQWAQLYREDADGKRADMRAAVIAHTIYQLLKGKNAPARTIESFMVVDHGRKERIAAFKNMIRARVKGHGNGAD